MTKLSEEDERIIKFLAKYKIMLVEDTKLIYNSEWYHRKKIKRLIDEGYIKKYKFYYIELDRKGRNFIGLTGKEYIKNKSNEAYMERVKQISKLGTMTIDSQIEFIPSWKMKDKKIYTDAARKYLGELDIGTDKYLVYFISNKKEKRYIHQIFYDINKVLNYERIVIFVDDLKILQEEYQYFTFRKEHTYIILNSKENLELIKQFENIDFYELVKNIYNNQKQILFSDWHLADYYLGDNLYIVNMLFLDIERIYKLIWFYQENTDTKKQVNILTLKENEEILKRLAPKESQIIAIDRNFLLKGVDGENMEL